MLVTMLLKGSIVNLFCNYSKQRAEKREQRPFRANFGRSDLF